MSELEHAFKVLFRHGLITPNKRPEHASCDNQVLPVRLRRLSHRKDIDRLSHNQRLPNVR